MNKHYICKQKLYINNWKVYIYIYLYIYSMFIHLQILNEFIWAPPSTSNAELHLNERFSTNCKSTKHWYYFVMFFYKRPTETFVYLLFLNISIESCFVWFLYGITEAGVDHARQSCFTWNALFLYSFLSKNFFVKAFIHANFSQFLYFYILPSK